VLENDTYIYSKIKSDHAHSVTQLLGMCHTTVRKYEVFCRQFFKSRFL